jgi:hypothetical protein
MTSLWINRGATRYRPAKAGVYEGCPPRHVLNFFVLHAALPHRNIALWMAKLSERGPRFSVAVRACAGGRFTFEIFTVSGERRTLQVESRHYSSPGDAQRAGCEAIAAKDPQAQDIDKAPRVTFGREFGPSPDSKSGDVELEVLFVFVTVTTIIIAIIAWYAVGALLR